MYWREDGDEDRGFTAPEDVFDLVFRLQGESIRIDHAFALAQSLRGILSPEACERIGVHGIRMAASGNGWQRPDAADATIPLSRRSRLVIRLHEQDREEVMQISGNRLEIDGQSIEVGEGKLRELSTLDTLFSRAIVCESKQPEADFMQSIATDLKDRGISVRKMLCGLSGEIRIDGDSLFTRALMISGLKPKESVNLQRQGIGSNRLLGCGLFVPHKGIEAVFDIQDEI